MVRLSACVMAGLAIATSSSISAQTLPVRPTPSSETTRSSPESELVLGKSTMAGVRRMFAGDPTAPMARNARRLAEERAWEVGGVTLRPRWELDPGQDFYRLYFDQNERLIFALDRTARPELTKLELLTRYPRAVRAQQSDSYDQFQVDFKPCLTLTALVDRKLDHVVQFGYAWTCQTQSLAGKLVPPSDRAESRQGS